MKNTRKAVKNNTVKDLINFYNGRRCVVSNTTENTDWHHLDDDPSNSIFQNLIPLTRDINNTLEKYRRYQNNNTKWKALDSDLTPDSLYLRSRDLFLNGKSSLAYGSSRLSVWMNFLYPNIILDRVDISKLFLQSLSCARHSANILLIKDIIERDLSKIFLKINGVGRLKIIFELGAILQEYGEFKLADEVFSIVEVKIKGLFPSDENEFRIKLLRRFALTYIANSTNLKRAEDFLSESLNDIEKVSVNSYIGVENALAWLAMARNDKTKAIDFLQPVISNIFKKDGMYKKEFTSPWNAMESLLSYYTITSTTRERTSKEILNVMLNTFNQNSMQLRPIALNLSTQIKNFMLPKSSEIYHNGIKTRTDTMDKKVKFLIIDVIKQLNF